MKNFFLKIVALAFIPFLAFAASPTDFKSLVGIFVDIIGKLVMLLFVIMFLVFIWGVVSNWIIHGADAEAVEKGKKVVVTGVIVFVILSAFWGILAILKTTIFGS